MATNQEVKDLRALIRSVANERSFELTSELDSYGLRTMANIPQKVRQTSRITGTTRYTRPKGEWDFLERFDPKEVSRLKRNWTSESGFAVDEMAEQTRHGSTVPFAQSSSEAGEKFSRMTAEIDAMSYFAKTGRLPKSGAYSSAGNFYSLLETALQTSERFDQSLMEQGFDVQEFLTKGNAAERRSYLSTVREQLTDEELHYKEYFEQQEAEAKLVFDENPSPVEQDDFVRTKEQARQVAEEKSRQGQELARQYREEAQARIAANKNKVTDIINPQSSKVVNPESLPDVWDDDYFASLVDESPEAFIDDFSPENFVEGFADDIDAGDFGGMRGAIDSAEPFVDNLALADVTAIEAVEAGGKVPFQPMFPKLHARLSSAIDQGIDLAVDVSRSNSSRASAVSQGVKSSKTTQNIIKGMNTAMDVVKESGIAKHLAKSSTGRKVGYTVGGLAAIGAVSGRTRDKRRN